MKFNDHSNLKGAHAFLSPSSYHWINYSEDKLALRYKNQQAIAIGTKQHEFARQAIELGVKIRGNTQTLAQYVNDAIGYRMIPEQVLFIRSTVLELQTPFYSETIFLEFMISKLARLRCL